MKYLKDLADQMEKIGMQESDSFTILALEGQPAVVTWLKVTPQVFVQNENLTELIPLTLTP